MTDLLAELEIYHSRPIAPTRRVAIGHRLLPIEPAPGPGGVLLAGIVARFLPDVDREFHDDYLELLHQLQRGARIPQPRLRHRLQQDVVGLTRTRHRLEKVDGKLRFTFPANRGAPEQHVLAAAYAAGELAYSDRPEVMDLMRKAEAWRGPVDGKLIAHLTGRSSAFGSENGFGDPVGWALGTLGFGPANGSQPQRDEVQQRFRELLRTAHPDTADDLSFDAAARIEELTEARRILLS
ncbi:MAG: hypothetical protein ACR2PK_10730 [Acidimicrobiales bacterium]